LIKFDVKGAEVLTLKCGIGTKPKKNKTIIIEFHCRDNYMTRLLKEPGYSISSSVERAGIHADSKYINGHIIAELIEYCDTS
jgi:hypothetical protein